MKVEQAEPFGQLLKINPISVQRLAEERKTSREYELEVLFSYGEHLYDIVVNSPQHYDLFKNRSSNVKVVKDNSLVFSDENLLSEGIDGIIDSTISHLSELTTGGEKKLSPQAVENHRAILQGISSQAFHNEDYLVGVKAAYWGTNGNLDSAPLLIKSLMRLPDLNRVVIAESFSSFVDDHPLTHAWQV